MTNTHWKRHDFRIDSLRDTISGLENSILGLKSKIDQINWYDGLWFMEESEPIYGLAFIAFQNYINSSIYDRFESLEKQYLKYKIGEEIKRTGRTDIELIISIANYFKHRDHPNNLMGETLKVMRDFNLKFDKDIDITDSPIFKGLEIFSVNRKLELIIQVTEKWREKLWTLED
jgi:hypothetical protein